jgi:hypothetical protein
VQATDSITRLMGTVANEIVLSTDEALQYKRLLLVLARKRIDRYLKN